MSNHWLHPPTNPYRLIPNKNSVSRETGRPTDIQADRQAYIHTGAHRDIHTYRQTAIHTDRQIGSQADLHTETNRHTYIHTYIQAVRQTPSGDRTTY